MDSLSAINLVRDRAEVADEVSGGSIGPSARNAVKL